MSGRIEYYLIPIKKITCNQPRSEYPEQRINDLAQKILATGVLLEPLVVVRSGSQSYSLLDGALNYHAAAKARELSPRDAEMVSAFVVESADLTATEEQLQILKSQVTPPLPPEPTAPVENAKKTVDTPNSRPDSEFLLSLIQSQDKKISQLVSAFEVSTQKQDKQVSQLISAFEVSIQKQDQQISQLISVIEALSSSKSDPKEPYQKLTINELKCLAQEHKLKVPSKAKKSQIIDLLIQKSIPPS